MKKKTRKLINKIFHMTTAILKFQKNFFKLQKQTIKLSSAEWDCAWKKIKLKIEKVFFSCKNINFFSIFCISVQIYNGYEYIMKIRITNSWALRFQNVKHTNNISNTKMNLCNYFFSNGIVTTWGNLNWSWTIRKYQEYKKTKKYITMVLGNV